MTKTDQQLAKLRPAVEAELTDFMNYCILALDDLGQLNKQGSLTVDPNIAARLRHALHAMQDAFISISMMQEVTRDLYESLDRRLAEAESAQDAYTAGWEARYAEIVARLSPEENNLLRRALEHD